MKEPFFPKACKSSSTGRDAWFTSSSEGWKCVNAGCPLGGLLLEAGCNSLDEGASCIDLRLGEGEVSVEDNALRGVSDGRLIYTLFLTDKAAAAGAGDAGAKKPRSFLRCLCRKLPLDLEETPSEEGASRIARLDFSAELEEAG